MAGMRFRKLRIAFSATCAIACVLFIALWVRSYAHGGQLPAPQGIVLLSKSGVGAVLKLPVHTDDTGVTVWNLQLSHPIAPIWPLKAEPAGTPSGFLVQWRSWSSWTLQSPYWFLVLLTGSLAAAPWIRWWF